MNSYKQARERFGSIKLVSLQDAFLWDELNDAAEHLEKAEARLKEAQLTFCEMTDTLLGPEQNPLSYEESNSICILQPLFGKLTSRFRHKQKDILSCRKHVSFC